MIEQKQSHISLKISTGQNSLCVIDFMRFVCVDAMMHMTSLLSNNSLKTGDMNINRSNRRTIAKQIADTVCY